MIITTLVFIIALSGVNAANTTITENTTGGINGALNNASVNPGDTIFLEPGTYNKTGQDTNIVINKNVTIQGIGSANNVIIDAQGLSRIFTLNNNLNITFINIKFLNGSNTGNGGAIYNQYTRTMMTFLNCAFTNNNAYCGGAIYNDGFNFTIKNSTFTNNIAHQAGAIYNSASNFTVINSNFTNNTASRGSDGYGGAIFDCWNSNSTIINSNFNNNSAGWGGAIFNWFKDDVTIINSNFTNNSVLYYGAAGGAIYNEGDNYHIINSIFKDNIATWGYGGAIINHGANFTVINSTFTNNTAYISGGAIYNHRLSTAGSSYGRDGTYNFTVINSTFTDNTSESGGAIYNFGNYSTITNSTFTDNKAETEGSADRGGAVFNNGNLTLTNSTFINNKAGTGGAIYNNANSNMSVFSNIMVGNSAILGQMIYNNGSIGVLNLTYLNNSTQYVKLGQVVTLYAILTDDMGNTVTGQSISFYVNGTFIGNQTATEGRVEISYLVNYGLGVVSGTGDYEGHTGFDIFIKDGQLLVITETDIIGTIDLNKDKYKVNEILKGNINVINNGPDTAYDIMVKVNLPYEFILNGGSVIVSHGYFDPLTKIWYIGNLTVGEEATMKFTGIFIKPGTYTLDIVTSSANIENSTDSATALVEEEVEQPEEPVKPEQPEEPAESEEPEKLNENNEVAQAAMKTTGMPINLIFLMLLSVLGILIGRKQ